MADKPLKSPDELLRENNAAIEYAGGGYWVVVTTLGPPVRYPDLCSNSGRSLKFTSERDARGFAATLPADWFDRLYPKEDTHA